MKIELLLLLSSILLLGSLLLLSLKCLLLLASAGNFLEPTKKIIL